MNLLKVLGWIFFPYFMLPFQWRKISTTKRLLALAWIAIIFTVAVLNPNSDDVNQSMVSSSEVAQTTTTEPSKIDDETTNEPSASNEVIEAIKDKDKKNQEETTISNSKVVPEMESESGTATEKITVSEGEYDLIIHFPAERYPETATHIQTAIKNGESAVCTIDRDGAEENRDESLNGIPTKKGYDRDEWPMAMCAEGGEGADIAYIDPSDNRGAGSWVGNQLEGYTDGTRVLFVIDGGKSGEVIEANKEASNSSTATTKPTEQPKETTKPTPTPAPVKEESKSETVYYANCSAVRAAGAAPLYEGEPGYSTKLDRDKDGVACE